MKLLYITFAQKW